MKDEHFIQFKKAKDLVEQRKYGEANKILENLLKKEPNDSFIKFEYAKNLLNIGYNEKAKYYFEQLMQIGDKKGRTYAALELGRIYVCEGNNEKAKNYFKSLLTTDNKPFAMLELGRLYVRENDDEKAKKLFEQLLKIGNEKDKAYALMELLKLSIKNKKYNQALQFLDKIVTIDTLLTSSQIKKYQIFLKYKLGKITNDELSRDYFGKQIAHYNLKSALKCIEKNVGIDGKNKPKGKFNSNIDIQDLFDICDEAIYEIKPYSYDVVDKYIVALDYNIGIIMGMETNLVEVVTISNTKDIITMYPVLSKQNEAITKKTKTKKRNY